MLLTKLKMATAALLAAGVLGGGTVGLAYRVMAGQAALAPQGAECAPPSRSPDSSPKRQAVQPAPFLVVTEEERLQGDWTCIRAEEDGSEGVPNDATGSLRLTIHGHRISAVYTAPKETSTVSFTFKVDPTTTPQSIDLHRGQETPEGKNIPGIYLIRGDTLSLCVDGTGTRRPRRFTAPKGSGRNLLVFRREPAKAEPATSSVQQIEESLRRLRENSDDRKAVLGSLAEIERTVRQARERLQKEPSK